MTPEQIIAPFLKPQQRILHIGGDAELASLASADEYTQIGIEQIDNIPNKPYEYAVLTEVLELVEDPVALIEKIKNITKSTIIYEYKYDEDCEVKPEWRQAWKSVGLEYTLTRNFDYVNSIFLGYATIHVCELPYNPELDTTKEHPDAIR